MAEALRKESIAGGMVLYDPEQVSEVSSELFSIDYWQTQKAVLGSAAGRGTAWIVGEHQRPWVLRQYHRGGWARKLFERSYLWFSEARARPFMEFRLLHELKAEGLPVPIPVAARYIRRGFLYQGDLITVFLKQTESLAQKCDQGHVDEELWAGVGVTLKRFHGRGVDHTDLNANNVLISDDGQVHLVDFDRCKRKRPGRWAQGNLNRLERSLRKLATQRGGSFPAVGWRALRQAYSEA